MPLFSIPQLKAAAKLPVVLNTEQRKRYARRALRESVENVPMDTEFDVFLSHKYLEADETLTRLRLRPTRRVPCGINTKGSG